MSRVSDRWRFPPRAPFYSLPEGVLLWMAGNLTPLEERIMHRILAAWDWNGDSVQSISENAMAKQCATTRRSVSRALGSLADKAVIDFIEGTQGRPPEIAIKPLLRRLSGDAQLAASRHKLTRSQLAASRHKHLSPESTSEDAQTCTPVASRVVTQREEPEFSRGARKAQVGEDTTLRAQSDRQKSRNIHDRFEERRRAALAALEAADRSAS